MATKKPGTLNVARLEKTFDSVAAKGDALVVGFFDKLFEDYPAIVPMFTDWPRADLETSLGTAMVHLRQAINSPEELQNALTEYGAHLRGRGAVAPHNDAFTATFLAVFRRLAGKSRTKPAQKIWTDALNFVASAMDPAPHPSKDTMATKSENAIEPADYQRMVAAFRTSAAPTILVDRNMVITEVNEATSAMVNEAAAMSSMIDGSSVVSPPPSSQARAT